MSDFAVLTSVRRLRRLLAAQHGQEERDEQLLDAFAEHHDESAFAELIRRHGPMVLGVCRRVLGCVQDAEDAYQATFLVLARHATALRDKTALASFLHGTAYHLASKIKRAAGRRRKHEACAPARPSVNPADELMWREVRELLDEEIARLPEKYRNVFVLCCLENLSQAEAGRRLGLKERTVSNRLAAGRKRLQTRLSRRGVELSALLAAATLTTETASALPAALLTKAIEGTVSPAVAALAESGSAVLSIGKIKLAAVFLLASSVLTSAGLWAYRGPTAPSGNPPQPDAKEKGDDRPKPRTPRKEDEQTVEVSGRVLDPDGKPAAGARLYIDPPSVDERPSVFATAAEDGRFSFRLAPSALVYRETKVHSRTIRIVATAKGYGPDWLDVPLADLDKKATLRLVKDDVPIQGRVLSLEGKPVAGVKVNVEFIEAFPKGDLTRALQAVRKGSHMRDITEVRTLSDTHDPLRTSKTGADGLFRLDGIGRDRIAMLHLEGPRIHYNAIRVMTRPGETIRDPDGLNTIHGATFEYLVKPSRLIRGTVREKGTGKPLAGIGISGIDTTAHTSTDAQGRYELPGYCKSANYRLMAYPGEGKPYFTASVAVQDTEGLAPITADLEMTRGIPFEGKVLDSETGKPVPGHIGYYPLHPNPNVTDNLGYGAANAAGAFSESSVAADGSFRCIVLPGRGCLTYQAAKDETRYMSACVDASTIKAIGGNKDFLFVPIFGGGRGTGLTQEQYQAILLIDPAKDCPSIAQTIRLKVAPVLSGVILDPDGKPLAGVRVRGLEYAWHWKTLATAKYNVSGVNPLRPRHVYFVHDARQLIGSLKLKGTETEPLTVRLQSWAAVRGRLVDAEGQPMRHAELRGREFLPRNGRTDGEGRFRIEGFIPGLRYDILFETKGKPSTAGVVAEGFIGKAGEVRDLGDVRGKPFQQK